MNEQERAARALRASSAWEEFIGPAVNNIRDEYLERITQLATTELDARKRTDKITCLSTGLRVVEEIERGIKGMIQDGEYAVKGMVRIDKIENMTPAQRRLLGIVPY